MTGSHPSRWFRRFHPAEPGAPRLVCFPYAGGSASYFFPVSAALRPAVEVLAVQYPGRQDRRTEPVTADIGVLADEVTTALLAEPAAPTAFFGHSMGAVVGYEVARRLERLGIVLSHLYVSGRRAPARPLPDEDVHTRDDAGVLAELRALGGAGTELLADPDVRELAMPAIRGDYAAIESYAYVPGPPLRCPVTALVGDRDGKAPVPEVKGWAGHTTGPFDLRVFPGGHFYLDTRNAEVLAAIRESLPV